MPNRFVFMPETLLWCKVMLVKYASAFVHSGGIARASSCAAAGPTYNLMADGLEWDDESPVGLLSNGDLKQLYAALLNARTSVILGQDENGLANSLLKMAEEIIPNWPALSPGRRATSWTDVFIRLQAESSDLIDRILE